MFILQSFQTGVQDAGLNSTYNTMNPVIALRSIPAFIAITLHSALCILH
jgi:hypothetical protein